MWSFAGQSCRRSKDPPMTTIDPDTWSVREDDDAYPNEVFIDIPYGYIEIGGVSSGKRAAIAAFIVEACRAYAKKGDGGGE